MAYSIRIVDHNVTHHREAGLQGFHLHPWLHCLDFIWLSYSCTGEGVQMFGNGTSRNAVDAKGAEISLSSIVPPPPTARECLQKN